jgi:ubiquinone/menaquinone biosynthesis C-methylase UbiE
MQDADVPRSHEAYTMALDDKLFLAPLPDTLEKVLDVGTGSGIWAIDFADQFPGAQVIGTDLSPTQPSWSPPNCKFEIDDATQPWTYQPDSFDYIHARLLVGSIVDWNALFAEAFKACKPGGYVESMEMDIGFHSDDGSVGPGSAMYDWYAIMTHGGKVMGRSTDIYKSRAVETAFKAAGFVDITKKEIKIPATKWAKDPRQSQIGEINHVALDAGLEGMSCLSLLLPLLG